MYVCLLQTPQLGDCTNPKCTTVRSKLHSLELEHEKGKLRVSQLESIVEDMKEQIRVLEISKNEAVGDMAAARAEVLIHRHRINGGRGTPPPPIFDSPIRNLYTVLH